MIIAPDKRSEIPRKFSKRANFSDSMGLKVALNFAKKVHKPSVVGTAPRTELAASLLLMISDFESSTSAAPEVVSESDKMSEMLRVVLLIQLLGEEERISRIPILRPKKYSENKSRPIPSKPQAKNFTILFFPKPKKMNVNPKINSPKAVFSCRGAQDNG